MGSIRQKIGRIFFFLRLDVIKNKYSNVGWKIWLLSILSITIGAIDSIPIFPSIIAPAIAQINNNQADSLHRTGEEQLGYNQLFAAETSLLQALRLYQSQGDRQGEQVTLIDLGVIYFRQGQDRRALEYLQQAEGIDGQSPSLARLWNTRGQIYLESGEYLEAFFAFQRTLSYSIRDLDERNRVDIGFGEVYRYLGQYRKANNYLELATRTTTNRYDRGRVYNSLGELYFDLGQYEKALTAYQEALTIRKAIGDNYGLVRTLSNLGRVYQQSQKIEEAIASYEEADRLSTSLGDWRSKIYILNNLSTIYEDKGDKNKALSFLQSALAAGENPRSVAGIETLNNFGKFYLQDKQYEKALEYYQQARNLSSGLNYTFGEGKSSIGMGEATLLQGDNKKAIEYIEAGIQDLESLRPGLTDEQKVAIFDTQAYAYELYQKALIETGDYQTALIVAERGRSRAFVEQLAKRINPNQDNENIHPPTIAQIQTIAKTAKATLVEYSILSDSKGNERDLLFWVIKPTGEISFRRLNLDNTLNNPQDSSLGTIVRSSLPAEFRGIKNLTTSLRGNLTARTESSANVEKSNRTAHATLIAPIVDLLPTNPDDRVIFIPQASLFLVPFPALQDSNGKYLIEQHTISLAPSIQILGLTQQKTSRNNPASNLIIGNPSPLPENLDPLPGAETEAKEIAAILQSKPLIGTEATKTAVIAKIKQASLIHLATHGFFDERQGLQSSLAFSTADREDGLLTADDILSLKLKADLAVLSACDTGRGQITGDGVIGLSRSFIAAGVPSVIVSLWSVPDLPTAQLMVEFYRHRQQGMDTTQSLRQAMLTVMKTYPNPIDWAAFVAIGQPD
jgi:CHAT domain-containing protein/Tfp pilus assembly protein PilF